MKAILAGFIAIAMIGIVSAGGDFGAASAAMGAAASSLGSSTGASVIGGYGSGSSSSDPSASSGLSLPSMADIQGKISANLGALGGGSGSQAVAPAPQSSISDNLGALVSLPTSSSPAALPSMADIQGKISANLGAIGGGSSLPGGVGGSAASSGTGGPSVSSPCAGVMTSSLPASSATYAAAYAKEKFFELPPIKPAKEEKGEPEHN